jgi:hypothetical protein
MIKALCLDLYNANVIFCTTSADMRIVLKLFHEDYVEQWDAEDKKQTCEGWTVPEFPVVMYSKKGEGNVSHEAVHVAAVILGDRGIKFEHPEEEVLAYPVGWIVEKWYEKKGWMTGKQFEKEIKEAL